jgi:hypothetical protein
MRARTLASPAVADLSLRARWALILAALAALVVVFLVVRGGGSSSGHGGPATVRVVHAKPDGGVRTFTFHQGDRIHLRVVSDTADEIHVHGYDLMKDVPAGGTVQFDFPASIEGRFDVELESRSTQLATLEVQP